MFGLARIGVQEVEMLFLLSYDSWIARTQCLQCKKSHGRTVFI